ncbi:class I SAM-dependent methyltransferase [Nocardia alni]|uniref:class I SAM-dependent methyltransferase n=1 Tax=Nocardia alni TaxID=2815723 RepID=UPI0027DF6934|nr:class I SAM-dependent methyltransferase [Nocardia alni]
MTESTTTEPVDIRATREAYDRMAELYTRRFANALAAEPFDRAMLGVFTELVQADGGGPVADIGCGPGRITTHLDALGLDVFGIDLSPEMIRLARAARPDLRYEVGTMEALPLGEGALSGLVAWYSIIHLPPERVPGMLAEFARVLCVGGRLLMAFQTTDVGLDLQPHDHKVTRSYRWSVSRVEELLRPCGFEVMAQLLRAPEPESAYGAGYLIATRVDRG